MKYAIVLPDGAADDSLPQLGGRTPLEMARIPNMDWVAQNGRLGRMVTIPDGYTPGTDVGTLTVLGYDPDVYYSGRAPIEAAAKGLSVRPDQMIFRCNFVNIADGLMKDFTAHHIAQPDADALIHALNSELRDAGCEFHAGVSYRNLLLLADGADLKLRCGPPHDILDQPIAPHLPAGAGFERLIRIMDRARGMIAAHDVNRRRRAAGEPLVTDIWLWGQGRPVPFESFASRFGPRGAVITGVDILRGFARLLGMEVLEVPGATGYIDTNYAGKGEAAARALDDFDMIVVHVEAADEAAHMGDAQEKIKALERMDQAVVGPLLERLAREPEWRILVAADHPTMCTTRGHSAVPPLFAFAGTGIAAVEKDRFTEPAADRGGYWIRPGHRLMNAFLES